MRTEGMDNKQFVITIEWIMNAEDLLSGGTDDELDILNESGYAEITDIKLRDKEER